MLRHVVLFRWDDGVTDAQRQALADALAGLPAAIEEIRSYRFGPDAGLAGGNFDFALVAEFDDAEAFAAYLDHPAHRAAVTEHVAPAAAQRVAVQYLTD